MISAVEYGLGSARGRRAKVLRIFEPVAKQLTTKRRKRKAELSYISAIRQELYLSLHGCLSPSRRVMRKASKLRRQHALKHKIQKLFIVMRCMERKRRASWKLIRSKNGATWSDDLNVPHRTYYYYRHSWHPRKNRNLFILVATPRIHGNFIHTWNNAHTPVQEILLFGLSHLNIPFLHHMIHLQSLFELSPSS